jgi:hypothetical protein
MGTKTGIIGNHPVDFCDDMMPVSKGSVRKRKKSEAQSQTRVNFPYVANYG